MIYRFKFIPSGPYKLEAL